MAKDSDRLAGRFEAENAGGLFSGLIADENETDRRGLWRIGSWAVAAVGAVVIAVMANQASLGWRREQVGAADLARQAEQIQSLVRENQNETHRLASALETLNADQDRLFSRVTILEQGLDSFTGAISRQNVAPPPMLGAASQGAAPKPTTPVELPPPSQSQTAALSAPPAAPAPVEASERRRQEPAAADPRPAEPRSPPQSSPVSSIETPPPNPPLAALQPAAATPLPPPIFIPARPRSGSPKRNELPKPASNSLDVTAAVDAASPAPLKPHEPPRAKEAPKPQELAKAQEPPKTQEPVQEFPKVQEPPKAQDASEFAPKVAVLRTKFAVDIGTANSIAGLRALWRGLAKSNPELAALRPIIVIKENNTGLGLQLHLAAGPLTDAAAAAQICAKLIESERTCETTVFDGQRLAMKAEDATSPTGSSPAPSQGRSYPKRVKKEEPPPPPAPTTDPSTLSSLFGRK